MKLVYQPLLLLLSVVVLSCEKPAIPDGVVTGKHGNLVVNIATVEQMPFPGFSTRATVVEACSRLNFLVYDSLGTRVAYENQTSDKDGFGSAAFQLSPGKYQLVVVGSSGKSNPTTTNPAKIQFTKSTGFTDTFYSNDYVVVGDSLVSANVSLARNVALCRVMFTDTIPQDVSKLQFEYKGGSGSFDASTGLGVSTKSSQVATFAAEAGRDSTVYDLYTFLPADADSVHLKAEAYASDDKLIRSREFNVPMARRQITKFSGAFFSGSSGSTITVIIGIDTSWEGEVEVEF